MADQLPPRDEADRLRNDAAIAESIARRDESLAFVARSNAPDDQQAYVPLAQEALQTADASRKQAEEIGSRQAAKDPEGTPAPFADSAGNYAATYEVAITGGTGVDGSNSTADGSPAQTVDDVDLGPVGSGITLGDQPVGEAAERANPEEVDTSKVDIDAALQSVADAREATEPQPASSKPRAASAPKKG